MDLNLTCRLCLQQQPTVLNVFSETLVATDVHGKILKFLYLDIKSDDSLPKALCIDCLRKIEDFQAFYEEVEQNQSKFIEIEPATHYQIIFDKDTLVDTVSKQIINVQPYEIRVEQDHINDTFLTTPTINDVQFSNAIIQNVDNQQQYQIMVIQNAINDSADESDNESNNSLYNEDEKVEEFQIPEGFPKILIKDAKLLIRGRQLFELMSKFYKLHCELCAERDSVFVKLASLLEHYDDMHAIKGFVKCCDRKLTKTRAMALHMARHVQPDAFKCPECGKMMTCPKILRYHIQNHLPEEKRPLACAKCPRRFSYSSALTAHGISHLPEDQRYTHICDECGKTFSTCSRLTTHINTSHSVRLPQYVCHECGKQFSCKGNLTYHLTTHEQIHQVQCVICSKWLKNKLCLRKHMTQHSEVRHNCTACNYSSVNMQCYRNHMRVQHSNDKPYTCHECGRDFKLKNTLVNHMVQHTGERKYSCEFCTRRFASSGNYYSHRKRMHPNELAEHNQKKAVEKEKAREKALQQIKHDGA